MSSGIPVTDEIQGNLNIRDFSGTGLHGNLLVETNLTVKEAINGIGVSISPVTGATTSPLTIIGNTDAGQLAYLEQDGSTDHVLTLNLVGTGGTSQAALNAVSANSAFSCVEVTGTETGKGTIKIAHKGYADASDANASAISIDLQTTKGGSTGTAAQGIFITSTTDAAPGGNAFIVRYNSLDQFVIKSSGRVAIGNAAIGHTPAGQLEILQMDISTVGLQMTAIAGGIDMINLKDSGGNQRFQVNNGGNAVFRANMFNTASMILGTATSDFGGAGSALTICHTTDPSTNPSSGRVIIYVDASGNLLARTSAGNVRTLAAV